MGPSDKSGLRTVSGAGSGTYRLPVFTATSSRHLGTLRAIEQTCSAVATLFSTRQARNSNVI